LADPVASQSDETWDILRNMKPNPPTLPISLKLLNALGFLRRCPLPI